MTSKKHRMIVFGVAIQLLLIAIVCYAAFPVEKPENPVRLMYQTKAGKVLFDHQTHASESGYGLSCYDCHHHPTEEEDALIACRECHLPKPVKKKDDGDGMTGVFHIGPLPKPEEGASAKPEESEESEEPSIPESCLECHDAEELEDSEYINSADAIHKQCTECHNEYGRGPLYQNALSQEEIDKLKTEPNEWVDCNKCHVL